MIKKRKIRQGELFLTANFCRKGMVVAGFSLRLFAQVKTCGYQDNHSLKVKPVILQINLSLACPGCFLIKR